DKNCAVIQGGRVLHFAAEGSVRSFIEPMSREYLTSSLGGKGSDLALDIECIDLPDAQFDLILCSHVLEHVDDKRALPELHRILAPKGIPQRPLRIMQSQTPLKQALVRPGKAIP